MHAGITEDRARSNARSEHTTGPARQSTRYARSALLVGALLLPLLGLTLLLTEPELDVAWQHHPAHFWLVLTVAGLNFTLAISTGSAARLRNDARVFLVSLAFLAVAGFLGLHALVTPGVLMEGSNAAFHLASPIGLLIAGGFAAASSLDLRGARAVAVMRWSRPAWGVLLAAMAAWGVCSLAQLPPLDGVSAPARASVPLLAITLPGVALYGLAVARYIRLARRSAPATLPVAMAAAFVLLAQAEIAVALSRNWHASWWEWHLLMLAAFGLIALSAHREWYEERFASLYLEETSQGKREVSVLFADLEGFTKFADCHDPLEVSAMLNAYFARTIPPVARRFGGQVDGIMGDGLMVTFNTRGDQPDHARRAAQAALAIRQAAEEVSADHPEWPRFRIGVNTGEVTVGVLGAAGGRTYTVIGDAVNLASRLERMAGPGEIVIGPETARRLPGAQLEMLGEIPVRGKAEPVVAYRLLEFEDESVPARTR